jgi:hypothetical protein
LGRKKSGIAIKKQAIAGKVSTHMGFGNLKEAEEAFFFKNDR